MAVDAVDGLFECLNHFVADDARLAQLRGRGVGRQVRTDDKQHVLHGEQQRAVVGIGDEAAQQTDVAVQFIDRAVGFEAVAAFRHALTAHERGLSGVAGAGVEG